MFAVWIDTGHPRKLEGNLSILFFFLSLKPNFLCLLIHGMVLGIHIGLFSLL